MIANTVVRARINDRIRNEAAVVLDSLGLTVSDAVRIMLTQIARERKFPFQILGPSETTIRAIKESRAGKVASFKSIEDLMRDLNEER